MTEPVTAAERRNLPSLTSLRWYAALLVFCYHVNSDGHYEWVPLNPLQFGYVGVTFFFVLSGFILTWTAGGRPVRAGSFYYRRFARIYPAHLAALLATVVVALGSPFGHGTVPGFVAQLFLVQDWTGSSAKVSEFNSVSWSLSVEVVFYALFPLLLPAMRRLGGRWLIAVTAATVAVGVSATAVLRHAEGAGAGGYRAYFHPLVRLPEFVLGIGLALLVERGLLRRAGSMAVPLGLIVVGGAVSWRELLGSYPYADYALLPGFALLIVAATMRDSEGRQAWVDRVLRHRMSKYLGELSFAFYLVHVFVLRGMTSGLGWEHQHSVAGGAITTVLLFAACLAAAVVLHHGAEKPAQDWLTRGQRRNGWRSDDDAATVPRQRTLKFGR